jgi:hypothetical protein
MRRFLVAISAVTVVALPASVVAVSFSSPASAATSSVSCKKLTGNIASTVTISKCKPKSKTNKSASAPATSLASGGTITWASSGQTTTVTLSVNQSGTACPKGDSEYIVTGSVTGGTSTYTHSGDAVNGEACLTSSGNLSLVKKTVITL